MRVSFYQIARFYFVGLRFFIHQATRAFSLKPRASFLGLLLRIFIKRPEWLYYPGVDFEPIKHFTFQPLRGPDAADLRLCERLIAAYKWANHDNPPLQSTSRLWRGIIQKRYQDLCATLDSRNPVALAQLLARMFQAPFLYGICSSELGMDPGCSAFYRMKTTEELLALAEALGLVRTETPEQGILGYALTEGLPSLVQKIEQHLGISMNFPAVGGAYGLQIGVTLVSPEAPEHIYVATRICEAIDRHVPDAGQKGLRIVEIGAGFGGLAYWLKKLRSQMISHYTIIDLPLMNVCQGYFLSKVFGAETIQLGGEAANPTHLFTIIPPQAKTQAVSQDFHIMINENSMPEMPESVVKEYLCWAKPKLKDIFYSYNQEAYSLANDVPQTLVPQAVRDVGGYQRLSRNYSWVRRGYVEEIYSSTR